MSAQEDELLTLPVSPPDPPEGFRVMPGDYVAQAGKDLFWNKSCDRWEDVQAAGGYSTNRMNATWSNPPYFIAARVDPKDIEIERLRGVLEMLGSGASASLSPPEDPDLPEPWKPDPDHQRLADWVMSSTLLCLEDGMSSEQIYEHRRKHG